MLPSIVAPLPLSTPSGLPDCHHHPPVQPLSSSINSKTDLKRFFEISRTAKELLQGRWEVAGLQFSDALLGDSSWVVDALREELEDMAPHSKSVRFHILADTSYSSCCVDETAAEHVNADVIVHYGRACLSPTSRLPVIYVFTSSELAHDNVLRAFKAAYPENDSKIILMADLAFQGHVQPLVSLLRREGYRNLLSTNILHYPESALPNREIADPDSTPVVMDVNTREYSVFHISEPSPSLLLVLATRVQSLHVLPTSPDLSAASPCSTSTAQAARCLLGRRYASVLTVATARIIGILVNTLSITRLQDSVRHIRYQIAAAGKKSYTVVVGKLNPAKLANFAEVDGWVIVGCWESSLVQSEAGLYKPVITPFELSAALTGDGKRVWGGDWWAGIRDIDPPFEQVVQDYQSLQQKALNLAADTRHVNDEVDSFAEIQDPEESEPPEFDLRTGRLISHGRSVLPVRFTSRTPGDINGKQEVEPSSAIAVRLRGDLSKMSAISSPAAEFLHSHRTWQGLGTDFEGNEQMVELAPGAQGIARAYVTKDSPAR